MFGSVAVRGGRFERIWVLISSGKNGFSLSEYSLTERTVPVPVRFL